VPDIELDIAEVRSALTYGDDRKGLDSLYRIEAEVERLTARCAALDDYVNPAEVDRLRAEESGIRSMYEEALAERDAGLKRESALEDELQRKSNEVQSLELEVERLRAVVERIAGWRKKYEEDGPPSPFENIARAALAEEKVP
jgi:chromosome segregation ATPase